MDNLRKLRKSFGHSQKDLADILFVNQTAVSQWERGVSKPSPDMLLRICDVYNTTTDYLLGRTNDPTNYEDGTLMANVRPDILDACKGDVRQALAIQRAIDQDALSEWELKELLSPNVDLEDLLQRSDIHLQIGGRTLTEEEKADVLEFLKFVLKFSGKG
jgi:transcriptional regulator with XRE-family HTH domain